MGGNKELEEGTALRLDWHKLAKVQTANCAVVPTVVQNTRTKEVLIVAYVNEKALAESLKRRVCCLWSTSRNELWVKGATSGDFLDLDEVRVNCEQNSLCFLVTPRRTGACHTKDESGCSRISCYYRSLVTAAGDGTTTLQHIPKQATITQTAFKIDGTSVALGVALGASLAMLCVRQ